jgi:hypothetical protein
LNTKLAGLFKQYDSIKQVIKVETIERTDEIIVEVYLDMEKYDSKLMDQLLDIEYNIQNKVASHLVFHYITDLDNI